MRGRGRERKGGWESKQESKLELPGNTVVSFFMTPTVLGDL